MRKPIYVLCEQQRRRSACASAQSDSAFVVRCLDSITVSISEISSLCLASVAEQAGLSLPWSQTPKAGFLATRLIWASSWDYGTYHIGDQRRLRRDCASAQSLQSLHCSPTWSMAVTKGPTKNQTSSPTGWLRMRVWRMSLRRTKSAIISWAGSFVHFSATTRLAIPVPAKTISSATCTSNL